MEHHAASIDDALVGGRRSVSYFASGGNSYSPSGVKVLKLNLTGDQWLDPSTFRVMFQLNTRITTLMLLIRFGSNLLVGIMLYSSGVLVFFVRASHRRHRQFQSSQHHGSISSVR